MLEYWEAAHIGFVCTHDPVDTSNKSPFGKFIVQLMGAIAELESGLLSERVSESHEAARKAGRPVGKHPLMYHWGADKKLHMFRPEFEAAELFYKMQHNQGMSNHKIWLWTLKTRYTRPWKRLKVKKGNKREYSPQIITQLIELYRRYLWLTERGVEVFGREYLDATARGETPLRGMGTVPPELIEGSSYMGSRITHQSPSSSE